MHIDIRSESAADAEDIAQLIAEAFLDAPHTSHTEQYIVNALRDAGQLTISLVAEDNDTIVGHVAISPVSVSDGSSGWYGLGPIAVAPQRQGQGIGGQLMTQALAGLRRLGAAGCVVLGDPAYYGRFGFRANPSLVLADVPPEFFQAFSFDGKTPAGTVSYSEAFGAVK
ncbi:GNAT family N-acetyltransferase [Cupriavidus sp. IDO]|uniref:GNAT family N-acetyltransferase n=1 Tax=Cupriavidus sp. IDO TaxID=1539142 RepID=UPI0005792C99|nr:N-acetyltransferase [Cupriavidus sp. IDO]KWR91467.1 GCN5 family acetyltransferase [Cupriavidus sp. IDO]